MANSDNPRTGAAFELAVQNYFLKRGMPLTRNFVQSIGMRSETRDHKFDLGSNNPTFLVECKCHTWTSGRNSPSAKLSVWNEAMFYFAAVQSGFTKILVVKRSLRDALSLAEHYVARYGHLIP